MEDIPMLNAPEQAGYAADSALMSKQAVLLNLWNAFHTLIEYIERASPEDRERTFWSHTYRPDGEI
jgi:hypothetical protein